MTTLAQRLINGTGVIIEDINLHCYVLDHLAPRKGASVADARLIADKFMFEECPGTAIEGQVRDKILDPLIVWNTARPITQPMWMEWPVISQDRSKTVIYGFLVDTVGGHTKISFCAGGSSGSCGVALQITVKAVAPWRTNPGPLTIKSMDNFMGPDIEATKRMAIGLMRDCVCAMFVLCTPRVATTAPLLPSRPVRRQQLREHPTKPLIEFRTVKMRIGVAQPRYAQTHDPLGDHEVIHRRLHRVIGHYRVYTRERETPLVSFIPEHWRGDPELGIVLHNREVGQ